MTEAPRRGKLDPVTGKVYWGGKQWITQEQLDRYREVARESGRRRYAALSPEAKSAHVAASKRWRDNNPEGQRAIMRRANQRRKQRLAITYRKETHVS